MTMNEPNNPVYAQPQVLSPAHPTYAAAPPPRRGSGLLRGLMILFAVLGVFAVLLVGGLYLLASSVSIATTDVWLEEEFHSGDENSPNKVAIVSVEDMIMDVTERHVIRQLKAAEEDDAVKAIVLKVDSPGGTIFSSDHIHRKVQQVCRGPGETKPIVVSMQGLAASGGYYVSAPANRIFAERTTMTGSIGVIASFPNVAGLMEDFKVRMEVIKTGPFKDAGSPFREMTPAERERWQVVIDDAFERFIEVVSEGRGMTADEVKKLATGDVYTSREAKASGLVDEIGYIEDAIDAAKSLAKISDAQVIEYKRPLDFLELLLGSATGRSSKIEIDLQSLLRAGVPRVMYLTQAPTVGL
jgi:protease-4